MREEIEKILEDFNSMEIEPNEAIEKLLNLHIVSHQRQLLIDFADKIHKDEIDYDRRTSEYLTDEYLKGNL